MLLVQIRENTFQEEDLHFREKSHFFTIIPVFQFERGKEKGRERMREEEERKQRGKDTELLKDKKGKSKVCYDSTGPNDQRYYVGKELIKSCKHAYILQ